MAKLKTALEAQQRDNEKAILGIIEGHERGLRDACARNDTLQSRLDVAYRSLSDRDEKVVGLMDDKKSLEHEVADLIADKKALVRSHEDYAGASRQDKASINYWKGQCETARSNESLARADRARMLRNLADVKTVIFELLGHEAF